jgi:hypothetical protein
LITVGGLNGGWLRFETMCKVLDCSQTGLDGNDGDLGQYLGAPGSMRHLRIYQE